MARIPGLKGSYHELKGGGYVVQFSLGWDETRGDYLKVRRNVATEEEATALMVRVTNFLQEGGQPSQIKAFLTKKAEDRAASQKTFAEVAEEFIESRRDDPDLKKRTTDTNATHIKKVLPAIGQRTMADITADDVQKLLNDLRNPSKQGACGKPVSGTYAQKIYATLRQIWDFAKEKGYVKENVVAGDGVKVPKRDTEEKRALTSEQAMTVMDGLLSGELTAPRFGLLLIMCTGMRLSEMLALTWNEYDEKTGVLTVRYSMERDTQERKETKTDDCRTIPLMPSAREVVLKWRVRQKEWFSSVGLRWDASAPMVHSSKGTHILSATYERWWRNHREELGVPDFATIHTMRHTFATLLIVECHVDTSTAQSLTGHSRPDVLLQIYTHTHENAKMDAMASLQDHLFPYRGDSICQHCRHWAPNPLHPERGACWAKEASSVNVFDSTHACDAGMFEYRASVA